MEKRESRRAIKFSGILFQVTEGYKRLDKIGYGYIITDAFTLDTKQTKAYYVDTGIDIFMVLERDIIEFYPPGTILRYKNT